MHFCLAVGAAAAAAAMAVFLAVKEEEKAALQDLVCTYVSFVLLCYTLK